MNDDDFSFNDVENLLSNLFVEGKTKNQSNSVANIPKGKQLPTLSNIIVPSSPMKKRKMFKGLSMSRMSRDIMDT